MDIPIDLSRALQAAGAFGVLFAVFWLVLIGKLRLEREYLDMKEQRDRALAEGHASTRVARETVDDYERTVGSEVH